MGHAGRFTSPSFCWERCFYIAIAAEVRNY
jgi:hypothetical protein